jgi:hypothetical protein
VDFALILSAKTQVIGVIPSNSPGKSNGQLTAEMFEAAGVAVGEAKPAIPAEPTAGQIKFGANTRSKSFFESAIAAEWRKQVPSIVETGRWIIEAQEELPRQIFWALHMPFSKRTAQALKRIAKHPVLSNPAHHGALPACWRTLDELIRQADGNDELLEAALANERIHPSLQRKDIREALDLPPKPPRGGSKGNGKGNEPPPDPAVIWGTFSNTDKTAIFMSEGRTGLAALIPIEMMADLADHAIRQEMVGASPRPKPAVTLTAILRASLDPANDTAAAFERFTAKLKSLGLDLHDISIAVRGRGRGRGKGGRK